MIILSLSKRMKPVCLLLAVETVFVLGAFQIVAKAKKSYLCQQ
jgi:hypothetical protein